ncbi:MAG: bifunctional 2-C-methyl-D-erythritol 4-phosphate cytidylyltransferase/2-C-methyl-D-erythritol 2,4-cyclodiphosphate synthase [Paracoccaceae bacterium]
MRIAALIVAAGRGTRAGGGLPKQWRDLAGQTLAARSIAAFAHHPDIARILLVIHPDDHARAATPGVELVHGGAERADSVRAGLEALPADITHVLIHDVARPLVSRTTIDTVIAALRTGAKGAAPGIALSDALWRGEGGQVRATLPRAGLYRAQTPQGFDLAAIRAAHHAHAGPTAADDVEIALAAGLDVVIVPGDERNLKLTVAEDFSRAATYLMGQDMDVRLGNGYDVHRFGPGDHVVLCGVHIAHDRALMGHSDADVGMHALTDALYGALAEGDIGRHFPPSDPQWKGAASEIFLAHAIELARSRGYALGNADVTLICEEPKIGPHALAMAVELGRIMGVEAGRISVKATTSEQLGFTGRKEGIAAIATATLLRSQGRP